MRIGYFGGSFDPPHNGHLAVARAAARAFSLDKVLFVPTGAQPLKPAGISASYADRLAMVTLLCAATADPAADPASGPSFEPSKLEAPTEDAGGRVPNQPPSSTPNYTVDTLQRLAATLAPTDTLYVLAGVDAFLDLPRWRSPQLLLALADWIVLSRPGAAPNGLGRQIDAMLDTLELTPARRAHVHPMDTLHDPTTSTAIRNAVRSGTSHTGLLPPAVLSYIHAHNLYCEGAEPRVSSV